MKEEFLLEATDNGMIVRSAAGVDVIENTHSYWQCESKRKHLQQAW